MVRVALFVAQATAAAAAAATIREPTAKALNMTIPDSSAQLVYTPAVASMDSGGGMDASETWNVSFDGTPWSAWVKGKIPKGASGHTTTKAGASVEISFVGTGVYFTGHKTGNVSLVVDDDNGAEVSYPQDSLAVAVGLAYGYHHAKLTLGEGNVTVTNVTFTTQVVTDANTTADMPTTEFLGTAGNTKNVNGKIASLQPPDGRVWNARDVIGPDNGDPKLEYYRIDTAVRNATASFGIPNGTTLVTLYGSIGYDHKRYNIFLSPDPPVGPANTTFNGYSPWAIVDSLLYISPLDPANNYSLTITNVDDAWFDLHKVVFYNSTGGAPTEQEEPGGTRKRPGLSGGAIAGIVVGVVVGLAAISLLIAVCCLRKKRDTKDRDPGMGHTTDGEGDFFIEDGHGRVPSPTPYQHLPYRSTSNESHPSVMRMKQQILSGSATRRHHDTEDSISYLTDTDAGPATGERVQLMPPSYNPQWAESRTDTTDLSLLSPRATVTTLSGSSYYGSNSMSAPSRSPPSMPSSPNLPVTTPPVARRSSTYKAPLRPPRSDRR